MTSGDSKQFFLFAATVQKHYSSAVKQDGTTPATYRPNQALEMRYDMFNGSVVAGNKCMREYTKEDVLIDRPVSCSLQGLKNSAIKG